MESLASQQVDDPLLRYAFGAFGAFGAFVPSLLAQSACVAGILEDRDSCPKAPTNDTRVMAVGCPRKREKAVPGKTFRV